jgi:gliding motility-associated-like protein
MRILLYCLFLLLSLCGSCLSFAQDFSNKGKDFWVGYGYHVRMNTGNGGSQQMVLYFATESVTTVTVSIPGLNYSVTYPNIPANTIFTSNPLPKAGTQDARLINEGVSDKGIHISSDKPIVAYAHIYDGNVSGATLLFPTNTLGREYYSVNYKQVSNENRSNCWFYAVAVDTGTTVVQITPSANTLTRPAGQPYTVSLQQGQIINVMGELISTGIDPFTGVDLTGSTIRSISTGTTGCKRIAVFSGSGKISLTCNNNSSSADNYIVQAFPSTAWGKRYLTTPTRNFENNFYRVCVTDPSTVVRLNGQIMTGLVNGFFYEFNSSTPVSIEADKPVLVAQYISTQGACGNAVTTGDPEVFYISPLEQNIDRVILNSTPNSAITQHFINVVIKTAAVSSFRLDGGAVSGFAAHPRDPGYSYAQLEVGAGAHRLQADSGFNAIAYGYGEFESYGYNAGTNVKDLYQFVSVRNQYATVNFPAACKNSPFYFSMTFPYQPTQVKWVFGSALNALGFTDVTVTSPQPDSSWVVNDKRLYRYKLPATYTLPVTGTFPIRVLAQNPTGEGCSGEQEIEYDLQVFERPSASFDFVASGCVSDSVKFTDNSSLDGRVGIRWFWQFGDNANSNLPTPAHLYKTAGSFPVKYSLISDIGCISDTATKIVVLSDPPVAKFGYAVPGCVGRSITFADSSTSANQAIVKWTWKFGDNTPDVVATSGAPQVHTYAVAGSYTVTLLVENASGCKSVQSSKLVTIAANPVVDFAIGTACLPNAAIQFTDRTTVAGNATSFTYQWSFGDGGVSSQKDPQHTYMAAGPFNAKLVVTAASGCIDSASKPVTTIYQQPSAQFAAPAEVCLGSDLTFTDQSTAAPNSITEWQWDFGDGSAVVTQQNPTYRFARAGNYSVTLRIKSSLGCADAVFSKTVVVNSLPTVNFTVSSPVCVNASLQFSNTSAANAGTISRSAWDFKDGSPVVNATSPQHIFTQVRDYAVSLEVETDNGCRNSLTKTVSVHPLPQPGFVVPGNCINDPITTFVDTSSIGDGSDAQFQWLWNFGDRNATPPNNTSTIKDGQHKFTATGDYTVRLTVTSKDGCSASLAQVFTLNGAVPVTQFAFRDGLQRCSNDSVVLTDSSSVTPGSLVKMEIYWDYNNDPTKKLTVDRPVKGASYSHLYPQFFAPVSKTYRVKLVIYSGINCLTEKDTTITVLATPDVQFAGLAPVCVNGPGIVLQGDAPNITGTGSFSGRGVTAAGSFSPVIAGVGSHVIRYTFTGDNGCLNYKEQTVIVYPVPSVSAGPDKTILEGGNAVLEGTANGSGLSYTWSPAMGLNNSSVARPVASPIEDITYTLTVRSADGCTASDIVSVKLLKTPSVPNAFSPNRDGVHDRWEIEYLDSYPGATVEVFNRYGQKVFESKGYAKPWDGTLNGKELPVGTYYYIIDPKNGRKPISGFVDLIR